MKSQPTSLVDTFDRGIRYLRLSVTDRCDFRCQYCMAEDMQFLPRKAVLTDDELVKLATIFTELGVRKIRLTGGEPLIRPGIEQLSARLSAMPLLEELVMTTNGSQLATKAPDLVAAGVSRLNISIDTLAPDSFASMSRTGKLQQVLDGIDAAISAGFKRIRLNAVLLRGHNDDQVIPLVAFAIDRGVDIAFIEEMPLGHITQTGRSSGVVYSSEVMKTVASVYELDTAAKDKYGGPAKLSPIVGTQTRVGVISPLSDNFCSDCNRLRLTPDGRLILCLGHENSLDLRQLLRNDTETSKLKHAIVGALTYKPERHVFDQPDEPQVLRFMNATGG